jgi:hypothetical protein
MPKHEAASENADLLASATSAQEPAHDLQEEELRVVVGGAKTITLDVEALASFEEVG